MRGGTKFGVFSNGRSPEASDLGAGSGVPHACVLSGQAINTGLRLC